MDPVFGRSCYTGMWIGLGPDVDDDDAETDADADADADADDDNYDNGGGLNDGGGLI